MSHVRTSPHELEGNFNFFEHGLGPYWAVSKLLFDGFDGDSDVLDAEIGGEEWTVELRYQKGGIAPRPEDSDGIERLYEFRIGMSGRGERKINFHVRPRFAGMEHYESGDEITSPCDHDQYANEATNVRFSGSNIEPDSYPVLLRKAVQALAEAAEIRVNPNYFVQLHETSNITSYERYVRVRRTMAKKYVRSTGAMRRILELLAQMEGSDTVYKPGNSGPNEDIVGYNHRLVLPKADARELIPMHTRGKQLKHYHPQYVNGDEENPLHHPKIGVLLKKSLNKSRAFAWSERDGLRQEIDETLINTLRWSGIPIGADSTTFVADDHFNATAADESVEFYEDPTPEIEAQQEALLVTTLREMTDADVDVLEALVSDGSGQHPQELANNAERGISTLYRALDRLDGLVHNDNASVEFVSRKIEQEIAGIVDSTEHRIENAADRAAKLMNVNARQAASSAFQKWMQKYTASFEFDEDRGERTVRIDTLLGELKSSSFPYIADVIDAAKTAWVKDGRDPRDLREAWVEWLNADGDRRRSKLSTLTR
ncbi:hypothetical protein SAMN06269185_1173 [Natronoarchaeum philippinense]|uniref:DUF7845 domain-containing protein n=1 Tax=Natronoarchaeum philippinense TaxID=558529 RepID=A0A285NAE9_NATPI|nr:DNA-binding protein [Natronoarchaeum philippinense]SNZ06445.1 hypothetical protein SAMN06269185_1173 [Natronoarchaeum philippinense]